MGTKNNPGRTLTEHDAALSRMQKVRAQMR